MTNEEQQSDQPMDVNQPDSQQPETTLATDDVAQSPESTTDQVPTPEPDNAALSDTPLTDESVVETLPADALAVEEPEQVTLSASDDIAPAEPTASAEMPIADELVDGTAGEAVPASDPAQEVLPASEPVGTIEDADPITTHEEIVAAAELEQAEVAPQQPAPDYSHFSKQELVGLLTDTLSGLKAEGANPGLFRQADEVIKASKPVMDQLKRVERQAALARYVTETGAEEGFQFRTDDLALQFEDLYKQIKSQKNTYFQTLDKAKDSNFTAKTDLLRRLRELVESDESNADDAKTSWNGFRAIQEEWKAAGNINSPHNATLWATYHALVDRYYSNRNIYFELKELDRKKNSAQKLDIIDKVEAIAKSVEDKEVTRQTIDDANALFEEYKHIGPVSKVEQEILWQRLKVALDTLYEKRRGRSEETRKESSQLYAEKSAIYEELLPLTSFTSSGINDWNEKTKEVMAIQERWNAIKGPMPREEGKELSKKFWATLKTFFANKGEFFRQLEGKREENLRAKIDLCEQVEAILAAGEESGDVTQRVIELQKQWKNVGQVPEKQKNTIFDRFKAACDAFFNKKRNRGQDTDREFEQNLVKKEELIARIDAAALQSADLSQLNQFKAEWNAIGFVPKKDKERIQKGYIAAINSLVRANGAMSTTEKERAIQDNEAEVTRFSGPRSDRAPRDGGSREGGQRDRPARPAGDSSAPRGPRPDRAPREGGFRGGRDSGRDGGQRDGGGDYAAYRRSSEGGGSENRRRITSLENDIATYQNNIEFFARSKNADKLRADIEKKIADAQKQIEQLRNQD